jgi:hypothetical protein
MRSSQRRSFRNSSASISQAKGEANMTDHNASEHPGTENFGPLAASGLVAGLGATIPLVAAPMAGAPATLLLFWQL